MDIEQILNLFDSFWFEHEIINNHPFSSTPQNPQPKNPSQITPPPEKPFVARIPTRSISEDLTSKLSFMSNSSNSNSPNSVLFSPKLHTIHSSKDIAGAESPESGGRRGKTESRKNRVRGRRRRTAAKSRSMSELEFEELKGFMDLGFVFSEEDKGSSLASIVPGLNRLGKKEEDDDEEELGGEIISRPYLSEAWEAMEIKKAPLMMKWRFSGNEIDVKLNLKGWALAVASTVR